RGQGIGTKLFDACEKVARVHDCIKLKWECLEWNREAQHFYKHTIGGKKVTKWRTYTKDLVENTEEIKEKSEEETKQNNSDEEIKVTVGQ
ncbi:MAG: GNAT family N-acetyltransferase, partial [Ruminococcus sp.]